MSDEQPPDTEDDEGLQRWHDPWGLTERENAILAIWVYVFAAIVGTIVIAWCVAGHYLANGNG